MKQLIVRELRALKTSALVGTGGLLLLLLLEALLTPEDWGREAATNGLWYYVLPLMGLMIGCRLIARERSEREIEFSHSWPVTRRQTWAAKLVAGLLATCVIYAVVMGVALALPGSWLAERMLAPMEMTLPAVVIEHVAPTILLFGIGLLMSTFCPSPFNSMGASFLALLLLAVGVWFTYTGFVAERWGPVIGFWPPDVIASAGGLVALAVMMGIAGVVASYFGFTRTLPLQFTRRTRVTLGLGVTLTVVAGGLLPLGLWLLGEPEAEDIASIQWAETSPDGRWIAFNDSAAQVQYDEEGTRYTSGPQRYRGWIVRTDGSGLKCIARWPGGLVGNWQHQRWLPIHWRGSDYGPAPDFLWVWDAEQMRRRRLPRPPPEGMGYSVPWIGTSPGGLYLLTNPHIIILGDEFALADAQLPDDADFAGWAPDDSHVYFVSSRRQDGEFGAKALWAMSLPGGGIECVQVSPEASATSCGVSPDGRWVVWSRPHPAEESYVIVQSLPDAQTTARFTGIGVWSGSARWSSDSRYLWARTGGQWTVITPGEKPSARHVGPDWSDSVGDSRLVWSRSGERCLLVVGRGVPEERVFVTLVANSDGSEMRELAETSQGTPFSSRGMVGWRDDGRAIVYEEHRRIVAIDVDTLEREVIFEAPNDGYTRDE